MLMLEWQKPKACASNSCVEVQTDAAGFRTLRDRFGFTVSYDPDEWALFVAAVKEGEYE